MSEFGNERNEPLRASRDEGSSAGSKRAKPSSGKAGKKLSSGGILTLLLAFVVLGCLGLIWKQSTEIQQLREQFNEMNTLIQSTDESLNQSGTALGLKIREQQESLDEHWSEIKKLWGVSYDTNRKAIAENKALAEKAIAQTSGSIAKLNARLDTLEASSKNFSTSLLSITVQLEELAARSASVDGMSKKIADVSSRVSDTEAALKALDTYRLQINQQLNQLRQRIEHAP